MNRDEIWKDIDGYEGYYQVSNLGKIRSIDRSITYSDGRKCFCKGKELSIYNDKRGYSQITLKRNGKAKSYWVHILVAKAFIPNPNNLPQVNHIDEIKNHNEAYNLEWCTEKYNINYGKCIENISNSNAKTRGVPCRAINVKDGSVIEFKSLNEGARALNVSVANIGHVISDKYPHSKSIGGYRWEIA